jgi:hypothetical protein
LVVDADAVLPMSIPFQALETVSRQCRKRSEVHSRIEDVQLAKRLALDCFEPARSFPVKKAFGVRATERLDHIPSLYLFPFHVNQYAHHPQEAKMRDSLWPEFTRNVIDMTPLQILREIDHKPSTHRRKYEFGYYRKGRPSSLATTVLTHVCLSA